MKLSFVLVGLSVAAMVVMIFQAVRQELNLRSLKGRMSEDSAQVKRKEEVIVEIKTKIKEMKGKLMTVNTKMDELKHKKEENDKSVQELDKSLETCNKEKPEVVKKKTAMEESIAKLRADHETAKKTTETDIQSLKQQILDRDKAICAFADTTKEEARKLCGLPGVNN